MDIHIHHVHFHGADTTRVLEAITALKESIHMDMTQATAQIEALTTQVDKISGEIQVLIDAVAAGGVSGTSPEFDAALAVLQARVQAADDKNPDSAPV